MAKIFTQRKRNSKSHIKQTGDIMFLLIECFGKCDRSFQSNLSNFNAGYERDNAPLSSLTSSRSQMFFKIGVLKNFTLFTRKHLYWSLILIKLHA